ETNFWYFFQLEECRFVREVIQKDGKLIQWFEAVTSSLDIASTYKVPYYLQKRKIQNIQLRLRQSDNQLCLKAAQAMNNRSIMIGDKDRFYFSDALRD